MIDPEANRCTNLAYKIRHGDDDRFFDPDWPEDEYPLPAEEMVT